MVWGESGSAGLPPRCSRHAAAAGCVRSAHGMPRPASSAHRPCSIADELRDEDQYLFDLNHFHVLQEMEVGRVVK